MKVFIRTFGCSMNLADSEAMAGVLLEEGHCITDETNADVIIVNTCTVKDATDKKILAYLKKQSKPLVIAGCMAEVDMELFKGKVIVGVKGIGSIGRAVRTAYQGRTGLFLNGTLDRLSLPVERTGTVSAIIPIAQGCLGSCSYCRTRLARGVLHSYHSDDIIRCCQKAIAAGAKELWLTAEDTAAYGKDSGESLFSLIESVSALQGDFRIRLGMANPKYVLDNLDEFIEVFQNPKLYSFLHIPVQSGSNRILRAMNRLYSREGFLRIVKSLRENIKDITICTDLICGYPGESDEDFAASMDLIREACPDLLHISGYSTRPGTEAALLPALSRKVVRQRTGMAASLFACIARQRNRGWHGWKGLVLAVAKGKGDTTIARNFAYRQVIIPERIPIGEMRQVKVLSSTAHYLLARIC